MNYFFLGFSKLSGLLYKLMIQEKLNENKNKMLFCEEITGNLIVGMLYRN